ncbi:MAG TPA: hypothetical protein VKT33_11340, partial [Candidatus Angelobacter sp.]|nr:hypothetical protein [Candidatus Angelobacter sp.]
SLVSRHHPALRDSCRKPFTTIIHPMKFQAATLSTRYPQLDCFSTHQIIAEFCIELKIQFLSTVFQPKILAQ